MRRISMEVGKAVEQLWPGKSLSCTPSVPYPDGFFFFFHIYVAFQHTISFTYFIVCLSWLEWQLLEGWNLCHFCSLVYAKNLE